MAQCVKGEAGTKILLPILEDIVAVSLYLSTTAHLRNTSFVIPYYRPSCPLVVLEKACCVGYWIVPLSMGSSEFVDYLKVFLSEREKRRKNSAFTFNIMPNGVYGQPYFISKEVQSNHPANTLGKPPEVSGTVKFAIKHDGDKAKIAIPYMDRRSGHFRTVDNKHPDPLHVAKYALKRFKELGFDTSEARIEASSLDSRDQQYSEP